MQLSTSFQKPNCTTCGTQKNKNFLAADGYGKHKIVVQTVQCSDDDAFGPDLLASRLACLPVRGKSCLEALVVTEYLLSSTRSASIHNSPDEKHPKNQQHRF